jgi:hypothetical protein
MPCLVALLVGFAALGCDDDNGTSSRRSSVENDAGDGPDDAKDDDAQTADTGDDAKDDDAPSKPEKPAEATRFVLGAVMIDADGARISYAQIIDHLGGDYTNDDGLEQPGNAVFMSYGKNFFYGLAESPVWVRYSTENGFKETGRLSFQQYGISSMDFANVVIDDHTAVSVLTEQYVAVVWDPSTMRITGEVDLSMLQKDGYSLEAFTTVVHGGLVYIPGKWVNWETNDILQRVNVTIVDPKKLEVAGSTNDDRCGGGGRVTFDSKGYAYVLADGRNQAMQEFAKAKGEKSVVNCLLRIPPGEMEFEQDYFVEIPSLTGGLDVMTELEAPSVDSDAGFALMQYPDRIPEDADRVSFEHWDVPAYKRWRITLGDEPKAEEVEGANFTVVGFSSSGVNGKLYSGESEDGSESTIYETDPETNTSVEKFRMQGYFSGIYPISK